MLTYLFLAVGRHTYKLLVRPSARLHSHHMNQHVIASMDFLILLKLGAI